MKDQVIPKATVRRLPLYYRYLRTLHDIGKSKVSLTELSEAAQVDGAATRRDSSYFGELGKHGYGYDVENLMNFFAKTLNEDELTNVTLIGIGSLESALLEYKFHQSSSIRVSCASDVNEDVVGRVAGGIPVYPTGDMMEQIRVQQIEVAILTISTHKTQEVVNKLAETGVEGILNFTAAHLVAPPEVLIQNVDLTNELQTLIYFLHHDNRLIDEEE